MRQTAALPSHSLFIAKVVALHADTAVLNEQQEIDLQLTGGGLTYGLAAVREKPVKKFRPETLRQEINQWRDRSSRHDNAAL